MYSPSQLHALRLAVLAILDHAKHYEWSVQGMGMLRLYIRGIGRLHIWDSTLRYPGVSMIHNHSWDLRSTIVSGVLVNTRFDYDYMMIGSPFCCQRIITGYDCRIVENLREPVRLLPGPPERYLLGDTYHQRAEIIHRTDAEDATVTIMKRQEDVNGRADVFWPVGEQWGTALPRPATPEEIRTVTERAAARLLQEMGS